MIIDDICNGQNGDQQAILDLIKKFSPILKKYARKLETEDAYYDLQLEFLETILHLNHTTLRETSDGAMVRYLSQSVYHAYTKLLGHLIDNKVPTVSIDELTDSILYPNSLFYEFQNTSIDVPSTILTFQEANIFYHTKILGYSAAELARNLGTSRQNVNQIKRRAVDKLRRYLKSKA